MTISSSPAAPLPAMVHPRVLDMIGNTPMVDVSNLSPNPRVRIFEALHQGWHGAR